MEKGSKEHDSFPQFVHRTDDLYWPWKEEKEREACGTRGRVHSNMRGRTHLEQRDDGAFTAQLGQPPLFRHLSVRPPIGIRILNTRIQTHTRTQVLRASGGMTTSTEQGRCLTGT